MGSYRGEINSSLPSQLVEKMLLSECSEKTASHFLVGMTSNNTLIVGNCHNQLHIFSTCPLFSTCLASDCDACRRFPPILPFDGF